MTYHTHTWEHVRRSTSNGPKEVLPMRDLVDQIAASRYVHGLYPVVSMFTLRLYQRPEFDIARDAHIAIHYDCSLGEFVVQYLDGPYKIPFSTSVKASHWTKRHPNGFVALERCLHHLRWFPEESLPT